jgi:hypothetical protein
MYDSVTAADIPATAAMVAGYIDGVDPWTAADWARFPNAVKVRIARNSLTDDGHVLDVERGDALPEWAPGWVLRRRTSGADPTVYVNRGNIDQVRAAFHQQAIPEPHYWLATLDGSQAWLPGVVAIQDRNAALSGGHYDLSTVLDYWPGVDQVPDPPAPPFVGLPQVDPVADCQAQLLRAGDRLDALRRDYDTYRATVLQQLQFLEDAVAALGLGLDGQGLLVQIDAVRGLLS